jgi:hypothetical protein
MSKTESKHLSTWQRVLHLDAHLDFHFPLLLLLLLLFILRLPNYFEPYWYGDEGIYLTIGTALNHGRELYAQIIDHKTPLIYVLAMVQTQLNFRLLLTAWMLTSTTFFYTIAYSFFRRRLSTSIATGFFVLSTTLPWFEGNIPNGELFVMGFILLGGVLLIPTELYRSFLTQNFEKNKAKIATLLLPFLAGLSFGLAILTKVPALFDVLAFGMLGLIPVVRELSFAPDMIKRTTTLLLFTLKQLFVVGLGVIVALLLSILYFALFGSLQAYLDYGLLYNFRYAGSWGLPFESQILQFLFTLLGKFAVTALVILGVLSLKKYLRPVQQFSLIWFMLALFASLLSNRPYPHYFLQLMPPTALLLGSVVALFEKQKAKALLSSIQKKVFITISLGVFGLAVAVLLLLNVGLYPTRAYYVGWGQLVTGKITQEEYRNGFNYLMADNYRAAPLLSTAKNSTIFIWGTNPVLYALSQTIPAGRFTVAFHIKDFDAYNETLEDIISTQPEYIVMMNDEKNSFPELTAFITKHYMENTSYTHFSIWRRTSQ